MHKILRKIKRYFFVYLLNDLRICLRGMRRQNHFRRWQRLWLLHAASSRKRPRI